VKKYTIFPPSRCGSLDFNKGAAATPSSPIPPPPPFPLHLQLRTKWAIPGPEHLWSAPVPKHMPENARMNASKDAG